MKTYHGKLGYILLVFLIASHMAHGQDEYRMVEEKSRMVVRGTSSLHDWSMLVGIMELAASFSKEGGQIGHINGVIFICDAGSLKSDHKLMDKKTHEALNAKTNPHITFSYNSIETLHTGAGEIGGSVAGSLSIAGKEKNISVPFHARMESSGQILLEGTVPLKMSDFGIEPPTALMGTLKTGDEVSIEFSLVLEKDLHSSYQRLTAGDSRQ